MKLQLAIVLSLFALAANCVTACGDNPEKRRVFSSSLEKLKLSFSDQPYRSNSGQSFIYDKSNNRARYTTSVPAQILSAHYNPARDTVQVTDKYNIRIFELPVPDGVNGDAASITGAFEIICSQTRGGRIVSVIQRPKDMEISYDDLQVQDLFARYPKANMVGIFEIATVELNDFTMSSKGAHSVVKKALETEEASGHLRQFCGESEGFEGRFDHFFSPAQENSGSEVRIPIVRFDGHILQTVDLQVYNADTFLDSAVFATHDSTINATEFAKKYFNHSFQSGVVHPENGKQVDAKEIRLLFDFDKMQFKMQRNNNGIHCGYKLEGTIQHAVYPTHRKEGLSNSYLLMLEGRLNQEDSCLAPAQFADKTLPFSAYIATGQNGEDISVTIVDPQSKTTILSQQLFIKK